MLTAVKSFLLVFCLLSLQVTHADDFSDAVSAFNKGDFGTAYRLLKPLAEQGHQEAQLYFGTLYADGTGVT